MKRLLPSLLAFGAGVLAAVLYLRPAQEQEKEPAKPPEATNSAALGLVTLTPEAQKLIRIETLAPKPIELAPEEEEPARVLDPSGLVALVSDRATARAAAFASRREYDRLKLLHEQNQVVSTRTLETAEAALRRDELAAQAAELKLASTWGRALLERKDLETLTRNLALQSNALVRLEIPITEPFSNAPARISISAIASDEPRFPGEYLSDSLVTDPQAPTRGFLYLVSDAPRWAPGTPLSAHLAKPGESKRAWVLPSAAVLRFESADWVYIRQNETNFLREPLRVLRVSSSGVVATGQLQADKNIVSQGAATLLSAEINSRTAAPGLRD